MHLSVSARLLRYNSSDIFARPYDYAENGSHLHRQSERLQFSSTNLTNHETATNGSDINVEWMAVD
jgi:hypothetical protein